MLQLGGLLSRKTRGTGPQEHLPWRGWSADNGYMLPVAFGTEQLPFFQQTLMRHSLVPHGRHRTVLDKLFKLEELYTSQKGKSFLCGGILIYAFITHRFFSPIFIYIGAYCWG